MKDQMPNEAEHFQQTKDDDNEWGHPVPVTSRRRLGVVVSVRFAPDELALIRDSVPDGKVSQFIRDATLKAARTQPTRWSPTLSVSASNVGIGAAVVSSNAQLTDPAGTGFDLIWKRPTLPATA